MARRENIWTVPNVVSLLRLLLVPVFLVLYLQGRPWWALGCFATAGLSDVLDGLLARLLNQRSRVGAILDPLADKILVLAALGSMLAQHRMPLWLVAAVLARDSFMTAVALVVHHRRLEVEVHPTRVGKYATMSLTVVVVLAVADNLIVRNSTLHAYTAVMAVIAGLTVVIASLQYVARYGYLLFASRSAA